METTTYAGIDYGMGTVNIDKETGIRYGVISQNSVDLDVWSEADADYGDPHCPKCGNEAKTIPCHTESSDPLGQWVSAIQDVPEKYEEYETERGECSDYACENCKLLFGSESAFGDEPIGYSYESDGYKLTDCLNFDIFVLASPYYTFAQFCSPCVPGAGNLDNPTEQGTGAKCYALGHEWFDEGMAPYTVYRVSDDTIVCAPSE